MRCASSNSSSCWFIDCPLGLFSARMPQRPAFVCVHLRTFSPILGDVAIRRLWLETMTALDQRHIPHFYGQVPEPCCLPGILPIGHIHAVRRVLQPLPPYPTSRLPSGKVYQQSLGVGC